MKDAVHLANTRCDGAAHGGCQAACLLYWKEAWLERAARRSAREASNGASRVRAPDAGEEAFVTGTLLPMTTSGKSPEGATVYQCQATEIPSATGTPWRVRELGQYVKDVENFNLRKILRGMVIEVFNLWQAFSCRRLPKALRIADGRRYPFIKGPLKKGETPSAQLDLSAGELVRVKSKEEIVATLDDTNHNRGLSFDGEMSNYCGRLARVRGRVDRLVEESTGEMVEINSDCIILEGVVCTGDYYRFCTRAIYPYWREIWLERVDEATLKSGSLASRAPGAPASADKEAPATALRMCGYDNPACS
jgi:hypothetical protein